MCRLNFVPIRSDDYFPEWKPAFIGISDTDKTDNLTCEIIYDNFTCENYRFSNNHYSLLMDILYC